MVNFPVEGLDMRKHVIGLKNEPEPVYYDLYAVSNHYGSLNGGHYTAFCLNYPSGKWFNYNDSSVGSCSSKDIVTPGAYLLFYRRRDMNPSETPSSPSFLKT